MKIPSMDSVAAVEGSQDEDFHAVGAVGSSRVALVDILGIERGWMNQWRQVVQSWGCSYSVALVSRGVAAASLVREVGTKNRWEGTMNTKVHSEAHSPVARLHYVDH